MASSARAASWRSNFRRYPRSLSRTPERLQGQSSDLTPGYRQLRFDRLDPCHKRIQYFAHDLAVVEHLRANLGAKLDDLKHRHEMFRSFLQINLAVLATAHAVSEGIMRGVAGEITRKAAPATYGASGRTTAPAPSAARPVALSRSL